MATTLSMQSKLHGERIWRRVGERPYTTRAGRQIVLVAWETPCLICGEPFQVSARKGIPANKNTDFVTVTCPAHRMTRSEVMRLRYAAPDRRPAVFQEIKAAKLAAPSNNQQEMAK